MFQEVKKVRKDIETGALPEEEIPGFLRFVLEHFAAGMFWICKGIIFVGMAYLAVINPLAGG